MCGVSIGCVKKGAINPYLYRKDPTVALLPVYRVLTASSDSTSSYFLFVLRDACLNPGSGGGERERGIPQNHKFNVRLFSGTNLMLMHW